MNPGTVIYATHVTKLLGPVGARMNYREGWKCRKGFTYVLLVLAIEEDRSPVNPEEALEAMGWQRKTEKDAPKKKRTKV